MRLHLLQQDIGRDLADNIRNEENCQRGIILRSFYDIQVFLEAQEGGIADVDSATGYSRTYIQVVTYARIYIYIYISKWSNHLPINKSQQIQNTQTGHHMPVDLGHQPALGGGGERGKGLIGLLFDLPFGFGVILGF